MKHAFCFILLWFALPACGQVSSAAQDQPPVLALPDSPSFTKQEVARLNFATFRTAPEVPPALVIQAPMPKESHKVLDRQFVLFTLAEFGATVADIESTMHALTSGYHEDNPLLGSQPSRAKLYGIGMPSAALVAFCSYEFKKLAPYSRRWMIPPILAGSVHGGAAIHNLYVTHN